MDLAEDDTNIEETVLNKIMVQQLMDMLESKERKIINLRYFKNKTQSQVAKRNGNDAGSGVKTGKENFKLNEK